MQVHLDHVHLRSTDAVAAAAFYVDALGARETGREGGNAVTRMVLDLGGLTLFIEQAPELGPGATPPHRGLEHIGLRVDDLDAAMADLERRGVTIAMGIKEMRPGLRIAFIDGPDAVRIELLQRGGPAGAR